MSTSTARDDDHRGHHATVAPAARSDRAAVRWGVVVGVAQAATPLTFWWLPAWIVLGYWFLVQFLSGTATSVAYSSSSSGGIAFWAHVGGFVAGIILIKVLPERRHRQHYGTW